MERKGDKGDGGLREERRSRRECRRSSVRVDLRKGGRKETGREERKKNEEQGEDRWPRRKETPGSTEKQSETYTPGYFCAAQEVVSGLSPENRNTVKPRAGTVYILYSFYLQKELEEITGPDTLGAFEE